MRTQTFNNTHVKKGIPAVALGFSPAAGAAASLAAPILAAGADEEAGTLKEGAEDCEAEIDPGPKRGGTWGRGPGAGGVKPPGAAEPDTLPLGGASPVLLFGSAFITWLMLVNLGSPAASRSCRKCSPFYCAVV